MKCFELIEKSIMVINLDDCIVENNDQVIIYLPILLPNLTSIEIAW